MERSNWALGSVAAGTAAGLAGLAVARRGHVLPETHDVRGKTIMITGVTSGIGLETAVALARGGARLLVTARDEGRGERSLAEIRRRSGADTVEVVALDLASLASVRACAADVATRTDRLDVLVNNAGLVVGERQQTDNGFEMTIGVNHLGPFLLTNLLRPVLEASASARVVTVASFAHHQGRMEIDDLMWERRRYNSMAVYGTSKLANILFTKELARRVGGNGVTATCLHPGTIRSGFGHSGPRALQLGLGLVARFFTDAEHGAATSVHLAASREAEDWSGIYVDRRRITTPSKPARDQALAEALWHRSAELVGL